MSQIPHWLVMAEWSPEISLLLRVVAVRAMYDSAQKTCLTRLSEDGPDWNLLLAAAHRHGLTPLLHRFLTDHHFDAVPTDVLSSLRQTQQGITYDNLRLAGELWEIVRLLVGRGVEVVPVKGPTLALLAFDDLGMRQFVDLDLLVKEADLAQTAELLVARGYRPWVPLISVYDETFRRVTNVLEFTHPEKGHLVEVHWKLSVGFLPLDLTGSWQERRLTPTFPGGKQIHTFAPEPLLVYLCIHAAKHCWSRMSWAADIAWLVERWPEFDWRYALDLARQQHCRRTIHLGLLLASDLFGATLPPWVNTEIDADRMVTKLAARVVHWWTLPEGEAPGPEGGRWERSRFFYDIQDGVQSRLRYLLRLLFAPNLGDWSFVRLPVQLTFLYAFLRPVRFLFGLVSREATKT